MTVAFHRPLRGSPVPTGTVCRFTCRLYFSLLATAFPGSAFCRPLHRRLLLHPAVLGADPHLAAGCFYRLVRVAALSHAAAPASCVSRSAFFSSRHLPSPTACSPRSRAAILQTHYSLPHHAAPHCRPAAPRRASLPPRLTAAAARSAGPAQSAVPVRPRGLLRPRPRPAPPHSRQPPPAPCVFAVLPHAVHSRNAHFRAVRPLRAALAPSSPAGLSPYLLHLPLTAPPRPPSYRHRLRFRPRGGKLTCARQVNL